MPWCPICKNEYVEGITECSDCKVPLVDTLEEAFPPVVTGSQEEMERLESFLEYSKFKGIKINHNEETDLYELYCKEKDEDKVRRACTIFYQQESLRNPDMLKKAEEETPETILGDNPVSDLYSGNVAFEFEQTEDVSSTMEPASDADFDSDKKTNATVTTPSASHESLKPYQKKSEKAADFKSSAFTLIPLGILGLIALACIEFGILPIHLAAPGKYLTYTVMGAMFIIFIIVGFFSLRSSKKYERESKEEDEFIEKLKLWVTEHINADHILSTLIASDADVQEEFIYFQITDLLKNTILSEYDNLDDAFLEEFIDGIYHDQFEDKVAAYFQK